MTSLMQILGAGKRQHDLDPFGIIDIGSNSVRLVVYEGAIRAPAPLFNEKVLCGLGRKVASTGHLGEDATARALQALRRFRAVADILKVKSLTVFATAAAREAIDGPQFIALAEKACGQPVEILSGEKEAELAAHGIRMGFMDPDGVAGDLGGGSLELVDIRGERLNDAATLPLGGLRLIDQTGGKIDSALKLADSSVASVPWLSQGTARVFYAVGGTWRALARLHMEQSGYPLRIMHGYTVPASEAIQFCEVIRKSKKLSELPGIEDVARARREVLPYGAAVLERLLRKMQPSSVVFSVHGVREGLLYDRLQPQERARDPLLSFCEDMARQRSRSVEHAWELCGWTDQLFGKYGPAETPEERRLRHAACLVSDIGWRVHPDYRGEQSLQQIAYAAMSGIDHPGRVFLGLSVYFRHAGIEKIQSFTLADQFAGRIDRKILKRARIIGAALRSAHMISIGMPGIINETRLTYDGDKLILFLPRGRANLDGERLERRFEGLAALLGRKGEVRSAS